MASRGISCPFCLNYSSVRKDGRLYGHKGNTRQILSEKRLECRASGLTSDQAIELRKRVDEGESIWLVLKELRDGRKD